MRCSCKSCLSGTSYRPQRRSRLHHAAVAAIPAIFLALFLTLGLACTILGPMYPNHGLAVKKRPFLKRTWLAGVLVVRRGIPSREAIVDLHLYMVLGHPKKAQRILYTYNPGNCRILDTSPYTKLLQTSVYNGCHFHLQLHPCLPNSKSLNICHLRTVQITPTSSLRRIDPFVCTE
jgi:hypothetical protein